MKIGILKTDDVRPTLVGEFGEYPDMFINLLAQVDPALEFVIYDVARSDYPQDLEAVDAFLMTGSKAGVYEDIDWVNRLAEFVRVLHAECRKLVGICFGHQMIAHALGGRVEKSPRGWGVGRHSYTLTDAAGAFAAPGTRFSVLASHQDQVVEPAEQAVVLAASDFCPVAMTRVGEHMLSIQGHPEFCPGYARALMEARRTCIGEARFQQGMASLSEPLDRLQVARWMLDFLSR